jgi:uncharacterized membrane protein YhaH (DUF805 family)
MSIPNGPREPNGPDSYQPGQQQPAQQGTYAPEEDIPRQEGPRADTGQRGYPGQQQNTGQRDRDGIPRQGGTYSRYSQPGAGYAYGAPGTLSYLLGAPVGFGDAVRNAFGHLLAFHGRASRSAFWWFALLAVIAYGVISYLSDRSTVLGVILDIVIGIPFIVASISLAVRRLHDSDKSGWWWWIGFVPVIGGLILLVMYLLPSTRGPNRFNLRR